MTLLTALTRLRTNNLKGLGATLTFEEVIQSDYLCGPGPFWAFAKWIVRQFHCSLAEELFCQLSPSAGIALAGLK